MTKDKINNKIKNRVAVSGLGLIAATGLDLQQTWQSMLSAERNFSWNNDKELNFLNWNTPEPCPIFRVPLAEPVLTKGEDIFTPTRATQLLELASLQALRHAGFEPDNSQHSSKQSQIYQNAKVGVSIGACTALSLNILKFYSDYRIGQAGEENLFKQYRQNIPSTILGSWLNKWGIAKSFISQTPCTACAAGTDAVGLALDWIQSGVCDMAIVGGTEELNMKACLGFRRLGLQALEPCKPFDAERTGLNLGEGAGVLILESQSHLEQRKGKALAWLSAYGTSADAYHPTAPHPEGLGLRKALHQALKISNLNSQDIDLINPHATATPENDRVEGTVIKDLFPAAHIFASKGYTGHCLGSAGAIEAVMTVQALATGQIPASAGFRTSDPAINLTPNLQNMNFNFKHAISQSLAFGGNNSVVIFSKEPQ